MCDVTSCSDSEAVNWTTNVTGRSGATENGTLGYVPVFGMFYIWSGFWQRYRALVCARVDINITSVYWSYHGRPAIGGAKNLLLNCANPKKYPSSQSMASLGRIEIGFEVPVSCVFASYLKVRATLGFFDDSTALVSQFTHVRKLAKLVNAARCARTFEGDSWVPPTSAQESRSKSGDAGRIRALRDQLLLVPASIPTIRATTRAASFWGMPTAWEKREIGLSPMSPVA